MRAKHKIIALGLAAALFSGQAAAGAATGGATEWTQIANNIMLGESLTTQTAMVAQEVLTATNTLNTYQAALRDLTGLPPGLSQSMLAPLQGDLAAYYQINQATTAVVQAGDQMHELSVRRATEMIAMSKNGYDPKYFIAREVELAARSAEAQRQLDSDMQAVQQNEVRLKHLAKVMQDAPGSITSTVSGLQSLQSTVGLAAAEAAETNRLLVAARVDAAVQRDDAAKSKAVDAKAWADRLAKSKAANDARDADEQARIDRMKLPPIKIGDTYSKQPKP
jgi:hypothetical protein